MTEVDVPNGEAQASGGMSFGSFLEQSNLNVVEFAICAAFWVGMLMMSSMISLSDFLSETPAMTQAIAHARPFELTPVSASMPTGFGPVAVVVDGLSFVGQYLPAVLAVCTLIGMAYGLFKYRASVGKGLLVIVRKFTRRR